MIILASASPRRIEMLTNAGLDPVVRPASIIETLPFPMDPETATMYLALRKASAIYDEIATKTQRLTSKSVQLSSAEIHPSDASPLSFGASPLHSNRDWPPTSDYAIIGADTVVVHEGRIIGKPADKQEAYSILSRLRATSHHVITGCCVIKVGNSTTAHTDSLSHCGTDSAIAPIRTCFYEDTKVFFKNYSASELEEYLSTDEAYDKAGGYAIQGSFSKYIDHIEGDYNNVVGLPLDKVLKHLNKELAQSLTDGVK